MSSTGSGGVAARLLADRSLKAKILAIVGVLAVVALAVGGLGLFRMSQMNQHADDLYYKAVRPVQMIDKVALDMVTVRSTALNHALSSTAANLTKYEQEMKVDDETFDMDLAAYDQARPTRADLTDKLRTFWDQYRDARDNQLVPASRRHDNAAVEKVRDTVISPILTQANEVVGQLSQRENADALQLRKDTAAAYRSATIWSIVFNVVGLVLGVVFALFAAQQTIRSVQRVSYVVDGLAEGNLTRITGLDSRDEIGTMAGALDAALARLRSTIDGVDTNSTALARASESLSQVSVGLASRSEDSSNQAGTASAAAEEVTRNVQTVAAGSEEMGASIGEIARSVAQAARVAGTAVTAAESANTIVAKLGQSSTEIGNVVKVITTIAEQTNLLALNATIEAARAGDAGKGFAVVAGEVKDLAQETAKATEDISRRIDTIQADTAAAVDAIHEIATVIDEVNGHSTAIASAVEQQSVTTAEISRNVGEAAAGSGHIARAINTIAESAQATNAGVAQARTAAADLARMSAELQSLVSQFTIR